MRASDSVTGEHVYEKQELGHFVLIDPAGYLCGHYSLKQIQQLTEEFRQEGRIIKLADQPTDPHRLAMLLRSFENPSLTPDKRAAVNAAVEKLKQKGVKADTYDPPVTQIPTPRLVTCEPLLDETTSNSNDATDQQLTQSTRRTKVRRPRYVTRSRSGLYLGSYTLDKAQALWPDASLQESVILVSQNINAGHVRRALKKNRATPNAYGKHRIVLAAVAARENILAVNAHDLPDLLREMKEDELQVFGDSNVPTRAAKFSGLKKLYGNQWFFVGPGVVQVTRGAVQYENEDDANLDISEGDAADTQTTADSASKPIPTTMPFSVLSRDGRAIYSCGLKKANKARAYLIANLPKGSFVSDVGSIRLKVDVEGLGYANQLEFVQACASLSGGKKIKERWTQQEKRAGHRLTEKKEPVSFDGGGQVLYIYKGTYSCIARKHQVEAVTGNLVTLAGRPALVNVNHCANCDRYSLGYTDYLHYRDRYGPVLGNFTFSGSVSSGGDLGFGKLSEQSILRLCGYNVSQTDDLSDRQRHLILANIMDRGICEKPRVMSHLDWLVRLHSGNPTYSLACKKWRNDLDWARSYHIDRQRQFMVSDVRRS